MSHEENSSVPFSELTPYAHAALLYFALGWGPLPVQGKKRGLPPGHTGKHGVAPARLAVEHWARDRADWNVALRMPEGVIGVDVDAYGNKRGRETLAELESSRGILPPTWVSGSRDDGASGIRFYRVPPEWDAPSIFGPGIECIKTTHRYAVVWPSIHPDTGLQYKWRMLPGWDPVLRPPDAAELPELPQGWLAEWPRIHAYGENGSGEGNGFSGESTDIAALIRDGAGPSGGQRDVLLRLTMKLAGSGRTEEEALLVWRAVVEKTEQDPRDLWDDGHFRSFFRTALEKIELESALLPEVSTELRSWAMSISPPAIRELADVSVTDVIDVPAESITPPSVPAAGGGGNGDDGENDGTGFLPSGYQLPHGYDIEDDGIVKITERERGAPIVNPISHRPVLVSGMAVDAGGGDDVWYEVSWLDALGQNKTVMLPSRDIADAGKLRDVFGDLVVTRQTMPSLAKFFGELSAVNRQWLFERRKHVAPQLGWQGPGAVDFALGPGRPYEVPDGKNTRDWLPSHRVSGSFEEWRQAVWLVSGQPIALALLAASFAAPLLRLTGARPFLAGVDNASTGGKTTAIRLAASVWGSPQDGHLIRSWRDTVIASEHRISMLRGIPYFLDETQHATDTPHVISDFIYALSEGHSKARSNQHGTSLTGDVSYETIVLTSGERSLASFTSHGGVLPRIVTMSGKPMADAVMATAVERLVLENHGHAGEAWMAYLLRLDPSRLAARRTALEDDLRKLAESPVQGRRAASVAVMQLAAELAAHAGLMPPVAEEWWGTLVGGGGSLEEHDDDVPMKALMLLANYVAADRRSFWTMPKPSSTPGILDAFQVQPPGGTWAGRYEPGEYLSVRPEWLSVFLKQHGIAWDAVKGAWRDRGWLRIPGGKRVAYTITETIVRDKLLCVRIICPELVDALVPGGVN